MQFPRNVSRRTLFRAIAISIIAIGVIVTITAGYVYYQAVKTFEVRRVSLPTRVYTDLTPLRPGVAMQRDELREKLERLGYRTIAAVREPGDFSATDGGFTIYIRGFKHPAGNSEPRLVRLGMTRDQITSVTDDAGAAVETAALEPELLTSILSDQLENRAPVTLDQMPQHLVDAVVVAEDVRFWRHPGVDPIGVFRALLRNLRSKGVSEGGSTLTQQLVKNYYLTNERTLRRKVVEAFMSVILDAKYSKREIVEAYLNDIYLGRNRSISILGVGAASRFYFGKPVSEVTVAEAATLAGMIPSPNNYSPFANPEKSKQRRDTVLDLLLKHKKITAEEHAKAKASNLPRKPYRERSGLGSIPFYVDRVMHELERDYGIEDAKGRGLSIYTAIDLNWQAEASSVLESGLRRLERSSRRLRRSKNPLEGVMIGVDVERGEIRALVGGRNWERSQFNRALLAKRQVGSLFKPFVFLAAFEPSLSKQNITPATLVNDTRFVLERRYSADWSPRNYNNQYYGVVTVRRALEQSLNAATVRIGLSTGLDSIIKAARAVGVEQELDDVPSLILGSIGIPPIEMAESYTTIARMGARVPLRTIRYVVDDGGRAVSGAEVKPVQVFPARDVYLAVHVMEGVVDRGTAAAARPLGFKLRAAGKTGTTNEKRDAWFIGFTPKTLALTWVGFDDNAPVGISGSDGAVPIWARYMREITRGDANREFPVPGGIVFAPVDIQSGQIATTNCPRNQVVNEAFKAGTEPNGTCRVHNMPLPAMLDPIMTDTAGTGMFDTAITSTDPYATSTGTLGTTPITPPPTTDRPPHPVDRQPPPTDQPRTDTAPPPLSDEPRVISPSPSSQPRPSDNTTTIGTNP